MFRILRYQLDTLNGNLVRIMEHFNDIHVGNIGNKRLDANTYLKAIQFQILIEFESLLDIRNVGFQVTTVGNITD